MDSRKPTMSLLRGPEADPPWVRPALVGLLCAIAVLYTWALDASGYGNEYYAAAAYSGSQSWTAWLFGSFDSASFISVDKPPVSLWVTGLSIRLFGLSSWSVLLPQAVAGVASVTILYGTVKRWKGHVTGLLAAAGFAITPIVLVMYRYNNPDAVLSLLLVSAAAVTFLAVERGSGRLIIAAGALVGLAFLTKTTQALLVIPAIAVTYLLFADVPLGRRVLHGAGAAAAAIVAAGWWVVLAVTSSTAPYAGQTDSGSFVDYILGVNGLERISSSNGGGPGGGPDPFGGSGGWGRLFNAEVGDQISWLIPLAVMGLVLALVVRSGGRSDRAGWGLWGTVFMTHLVVFSLMDGVFHPYYSMTMAPSIAALAAAGAVDGWRVWRTGSAAWWLLPLGIVATAGWSAVLLSRSDGFVPWLGPSIILVALAVATVMVGSRLSGSLDLHWKVGVAAVAGVVCLAGPAAYALVSIGTDYSGGDPAAGPNETGRPGAVAAGYDRPDDGGPVDRPLDRDRAVDQPFPPSAGGPSRGEEGGAPGPAPQGDAGQSPTGVSDEMVDFLLAEHGGETWLVATVGTQTAAGIILDTGEAVRAMGGFSGGDPTPTNDELAGYIDSGALRFVLLGGGSQRRARDWTTVVETLCRPVDGFDSMYDCAAGG